MFFRQLVPALALTAGLASPAQQTRVFDVRASNLLRTGAIGSADFHVRAMNIAFENTSIGSYDDFLDRSLRKFLDNYNTNEYGQAVDYAKQWFNMGTWEARAFVGVVYVYASGVISMLQSQNVAFRNYVFVCPAPGRYELTVTLTGSLVKPRNRVHLAGPNGTVQIDEDNPRWDTTKTYVLNLPKGVHTLTTSLGSGASATFDSAGALKGVRLNNPSYLDWQDVVPISTQGLRTTSAMSAPGASALVDCTWPIPQSASFRNVVDGSVNVDLNSIQVNATHTQIASKFTLSIKNCYGNTVDLPANFLNADLLYTTRPSFWFEGQLLRTRQTVTRLPDVWLDGTYTVCGPNY